MARAQRWGLRSLSISRGQEPYNSLGFSLQQRAVSGRARPDMARPKALIHSDEPASVADAPIRAPRAGCGLGMLGYGLCARRCAILEMAKSSGNGAVTHTADITLELRGPEGRAAPAADHDVHCSPAATKRRCRSPPSVFLNTPTAGQSIVPAHTLYNSRHENNVSSKSFQARRYCLLGLDGRHSWHPDIEITFHQG